MRGSIFTISPFREGLGSALEVTQPSGALYFLRPSHTTECSRKEEKSHGQSRWVGSVQAGELYERHLKGLEASQTNMEV